MAESVARFGCSAQARSYRNKPPPPPLRTCLIHRFPPVTRYALASWAAHPVPFALTEVRKLCVIHEPAGVGHLESVPSAGVHVSDRRLSADQARVAALGRTSGLPMRPGVGWVLPTAATDVRRPDFEFIKPSVVIRRRPQRPNPSGSA